MNQSRAREDSHVQIRRVGEIHRRVEPTHVVCKVVRHLRAVIRPRVVGILEGVQLDLDGRDAVEIRLGNNDGVACVLWVFPDRANNEGSRSPQYEQSGYRWCTPHGHHRDARVRTGVEV